jgi:hypothetical protein
MHMKPEDADIQLAGSRLCVTLTKDPASHRGALRSGVLAVLLSALDNHRDNLAIQELACDALCNLTAKDRLADGETRVSTAAAPPAGTHAQSRSRSYSVSVSAAGAGRAHRADSEGEMSARAKLALGGGVRSVLGILQRHVDLPSVIEPATHLISNLALDAGNRELMKAGGIGLGTGDSVGGHDSPRASPGGAGRGTPRAGAGTGGEGSPAPIVSYVMDGEKCCLIFYF